MRYVSLIVSLAITLPLMAACGGGESIPAPASVREPPELSPQAQRAHPKPDRDAAILEEGANINWALSLAQSGMGPSIIGDPTAVYGGIMTYRAALETVGSGVRPGPSQAWKLDREVYVYLFEGEFTDSMTGNELVTDWAQKFVMFDAETGKSYSETTRREPARRAVPQLQPVRLLDHEKGVAPREVNINRTPPVAEPPATAAPRHPDDE